MSEPYTVSVLCKTKTDFSEMAAQFRKDADLLDPPDVATVTVSAPPEPQAPPRRWDVMLDLETWGMTPGCALRSIGAVCFDQNTDETGPEFYSNVIGGQIDLNFEQDTVEWWDNQSDDAQYALLTDTLPLVTAVQSFREWFNSVNGGNIWSRGAAFDVPALAVAMASVGVNPPWHYRDVRDTRTLYALAKFDPSVIPNKKGIHHHALHDAKFQAMCVQMAIRSLHSPWGAVRGRDPIV
jgi:hypothetical protein